MQALPIDALLPEILERVRRDRNLVIEAPAGAGKTTRVPAALLSLDLGEVLVLEPRRLAARMAARRVAAERGERPGETVGYQVRFEEVASRDTRLRFLTEGVFTRRLLSDPRLQGVGAVVLDEFHERHIEGDLALALLRRLQQTARPELRIVVMSATLDGVGISNFLDGCPAIRSEGKLYELAIAYTPHSAQPLEEQVTGALERLLREGINGDVLVFLPGAAEIRRAARACERIAARARLTVAPLHGDLSPEEQDRAVLPAERPKVILSTNVAESSVTIEGVTAVIDSGLARVARDSPWSGLPALTVSRISKASATQRAGRAGRMRPGRVVRLYPAEDFARRPEHDVPEIRRRELSQVCLDLRVLGFANPRELEWFEPPPEAAVEVAEELLRRLGAVDGSGALTEIGRRMARLPLHPRLARLVVEAEHRGAGRDGCAVAALLSAGDRLPPESKSHRGPSDLLALLDSQWSPRGRQVFEQIQRVARLGRQTEHDEQTLLICVLAAFPDRVARRRQKNELLLAGGGSAMLAPASVVRDSDLLVAVDIEERRERGLPLVRLASSVEAEWLMDLFPERITERSGVEWNRFEERAEGVSALLFENIALEESRSGNPDPVQAARLLAEKALEAGVARFADTEEVERFLARVAFASKHSAVPCLGEGDVRAAIEELCQGRRSFSELRSAAGSGGLLRTLRRRLTSHQDRLMDEVAPARIRLPGGRSAQVNYSADKPPWMASRLQDFFGMRETPTVAGGKVSVVLHLLAPNQRPVQTTTDLAGFWERLYPQVRRELSRRYPKHAWPEDPLSGR